MEGRKREFRLCEEDWDKPQKKRRRREIKAGRKGGGLKLLSGQGDSEGREKERKRMGGNEENHPFSLRE